MNDGFGHAHSRTDRIASSAAPRDMSRCVTMYAAATVTDRLWPKAQWTTHRPPDASHARMNAPVSSKCAEMSAARVSSTLTCMCAKGREGPGPDDDSQGGGRFITDRTCVTPAATRRSFRSSATLSCDPTWSHVPNTAVASGMFASDPSRPASFERLDGTAEVSRFGQSSQRTSAAEESAFRSGAHANPTDVREARRRGGYRGHGLPRRPSADPRHPVRAVADGSTSAAQEGADDRRRDATTISRASRSLSPQPSSTGGPRAPNARYRPPRGWVR